MDLYAPLKRFLDTILSFFFLVSLSPLFLLIAILIKLDDGGRIIYFHHRLGQGRKLFRLFKFRSMVENADQILFSNSQLLSKLRRGTHKLPDDPRITRVGKFLRKYSLDELPQFINVLRGEMSLVGPRAYRPDELEKFEAESPHAAEDIALILSVKPGITGLWQVGGRSKISFEQRVAIEISYARRKSLFLDLYIMLKTPLVILLGEGM